MTTKQRCANSHCDWCGTSDEVLKAPNPFDPINEIWGCPECKDVNSMYLVCDEPGCWEPVSCGTPTPDGYRSTCHCHAPKSAV